MMNVMRTLINLQLRVGWNTWYSDCSGRRRIEELRVSGTETFNRQRCHRALRVLFEANPNPNPDLNPNSDPNPNPNWLVHD